MIHIFQEAPLSSDIDESIDLQLSKIVAISVQLRTISSLSSHDLTDFTSMKEYFE